MDEKIKQRLTRRSIWVRALYMVLFGIALGIAELLVWTVVIVQFFIVLFTGRANDKLLQFGNNLSAYVWRVLRYQTFNTESQAFPFDDWPEEKVADNPWREESEPADEPAEDRKSGDGQSA